MLNKPSPKISIITVVFNGEMYIAESIESVIRQSYKNYEFLIVDGESSDNTCEIISRYKANIDIFISEKDDGLSDAMNKAAKLASGEYIIYLHADDLFLNESTLQHMVDNVQGKQAWATGFYNFIDHNGDLTKKDKLKAGSLAGMYIRNIIRHQATIVRSDIVKEFPFDKQYKYAMDYDFFLNVWEKYGEPVFILKYLSCFRIDGNNLSSNYYSSIKDEMKVRINSRIKNKDRFKLLSDYLIYSLRVLKIYIYHSRK